MSCAISFLANAAKKAAIACVVILALAGASAAMAPQAAYADTPTYTMSVGGSGDSIAPGDTFTVSLDLSNNESSSYTMYAMSATVRYNTSLLEVVSMDMNNNIDVYTADAGDGWTQAVLNFKARSLAGTTWDNGSLMDITFRALGEGSSSVLIARANISNSTGMGSYPCTCYDALIEVSSTAEEPGVTPSDEGSQGSTGGTPAPEADPATLTDEEYEMTDEERAEYEATKAGDSASSSSASASASSSSTSKGGADSAGTIAAGDKAGADGDTPMLLYILVGCFVAAVVILAAGVVIYKRRK